MALFEWASTLYEEKTVVTAGDVMDVTIALPDGGVVHVAAETTLTAVVRSAAPVQPTFTLRPLDALPEDGTVVGSVVYRADGVKLGTVNLVVVTPDPPPSPAPDDEASPASAAG